MKSKTFTQGDIVLFGTYWGHPIEAIIDLDPMYIKRCLSLAWFNIDDALFTLLEKNLEPLSQTIEYQDILKRYYPKEVS